MKYLALPLLLLAAACAPGAPVSVTKAGLEPSTPAKGKPLLRDFVGLNVHTVQFKPELYRPVCRRLRDYHSFEWDVGKETDFPTRFPLARNGVDWNELYGGWQKAGYTVDASIMFSHTPPDSWKNLPQDAETYGRAFAGYFGPSGAHPCVESVEIGNEPGHYSDEQYRTLFESMAKGLRAGDPKLRIVTCSATPGKSGKYEKSLTCVQGLEPLYDVINVHTYAFAEQYPTWRRSYPEDPSLQYLKQVRDTLAWRDAHAWGKKVWVTEFGWDASTKPAPATGTFSKWVGVTDTQQAQYLVRSFLIFSALDLERAYVYFFNDNDEPQLHGSSGLTRNYTPKPAFHAVAYLHQALGEYRFSRVIAQDAGERYVYEYRHAKKPGQRVWAVWSPTGSGREVELLLPNPKGTLQQAERMPLKAGDPEKVTCEIRADGGLRVPAGESPVFLYFRDE